MPHMGKPDGGMFSIKMVTEGIFYQQYANFHNHDYDDGDGRSSLMNFSTKGNAHSIAAKVRKGDRSLVYVAGPGYQKFVWAIEYTGNIDDGKKIALLLGVYNPPEQWFSIFIPIKHLARIDPANSPTLAEIENRTGFSFKPNSFTMKRIEADVYQRIYDAIPWQWTIRDGPWKNGAPLPPAKPLIADSGAILGDFTNIEPAPPDFVLPPIPNAESLLDRIRQVQGMPERNMEDVVKAFLLQLGHAESAVAFQVGHVDVRVNDEQGKGRIVVEVKKSLRNEKVRRDALRKGFDYAGRVGAPLVVITDADSYEVYDQRRGIDYESRLCGRFQLTRFGPTDGTILDLLRPANGANT